MRYLCDEVRQKRMLSRRDLFRTGAAGAAAMTMGAATTAATSATPALAAGHGRVLDLTHVYDSDFPTFSGGSGITMAQPFDFAENGFNLFNLSIDEHTGTHIDAPLHFSADGQSVDEIPLSNLICPLAVIDIAAKAQDEADAQVTPDDIRIWIATHGEIPDGACVAMHSGWAGKVGSAGFRNADAAGVMHFPGFHVEAAQMLMEDTGAVALGVDTLSLDHGPSADFATHYAWLPSNRYGIENLAGLDQVPTSGATLIVGAPTHRGGSGGPARIFALA